MEHAMRSTCRTRLTKLINAANDFIVSESFNAEEAAVFVSRIKTARDILRSANEKVAESIASDQLEAECEKVLDYEDSVATAMARVEQCIAISKAASRTGSTPLDITSRNDRGSHQPTTECGLNQSKMSVRLPKIELIKFNGDHHEWPAFWEQFKLAIHSNNSLDEADKFAYLKSVLTGNAAITIQGLTTSKTSYNDAIELLTEEYGKKERVVDTYIQQLLSLSHVKSKTDIVSLRKLYNVTSKITRSLQTLGISPSNYGMMVKSIILKSLPMTMRIDFNKQQAIGDCDTDNAANSNASSSTSDTSYETQISKLLSFIKLEVDSVEQARILSNENVIEKPNFSRNREKPKFYGNKDLNKDNSYTASGLFTTVNEDCLFCKSKQHVTANCNGTLTVQQKKDILKTNRRCFKCTKSNHNSRVCRTKLSCLQCKRNHATTMCDPDYAKSKGNNTLNNAKANVQSGSTNLLASGQLNNVYLQTACAQIVKDNRVDNNVNETFVRLVLDGGSQQTFIKECVSRQLDLPVIGTHKIAITGFGNSEMAPVRLCKRVSLSLKGLNENSELINITAVEVPEICFDCLTPPSETDPAINNFRKIYQLADIYPSTNNVLPGISLLIGADTYWKIVHNEVQQLSKSLTAINTKLGWTIHGSNEEYCPSVNFISTLHVQVQPTTDNELDIKKFWELETIGIKQPDMQKNANTNDFLNEKITLQDKRYTVSLPWIDESFEIDSNYNGAFYRVQSLTKNLIRNEKIFEYDCAMQEYFKNDCAELAPKLTHHERTYYLPHRPVYRDDKETTRIRCVFDASAHRLGFPSLNDLLSPGENLVPLLLAILINFRIGKVALIADIEKAFLQIKLNQDDRDSHRFLWYAEPIEDINNMPNLVEYRMKRVTFGVTCSPFLLAATLKKHLTDQPNEFQDVANVLLKSFYVDDLIVAVDNEKSANKIYEQGRQILSEAGMNLRKWSTNDVELRKTIEDQLAPMNSHVKKVLGLLWYTDTDEFSIDIKPTLDNIRKQQRPATKREVLKTVSKVYDPLGLASPYIITAKILLQEIWKKKLDWDDILPENLTNDWTKWLHDLPKLSNFIFPRCILNCSSNYTELHVFSDASPRAYGAVAYLKSITELGEVHCNIILAKNRVSPITKNGDKTLTLPKLELTGALCAARLQNFILTNLKFQINSNVLWTDSKIALHWIHGRANKWKPYICHRVTEIQKLSVGEWQHCPGPENPADLLTRGVRANILAESKLWHFGPAWLKKNRSEWPQNDVEVTHDEVFVYTIQTDKGISQEPIFPIENYSNLYKILRITAYVKRFINNLKNPEEKTTDRNVTVREIQESEIYWIKVTQRHAFSEEITSLTKNEKIETHSKILTLNPFLDDTDILRLGGRLQESLLSYETKHPIVLPKASTLTDRLIWASHIMTNHGGVNATLTKLREKYWIIHARQRVKTVLHTCLKCRRLRGKSANEHFAPLPSSRLQSASPFKVTGVDFAGPLFISTENGQTKVYIMLLTCAVVRAVHLELVPSLSTQSCIRALRRFISRRGVPEIIYSDNAKTFKRTSTELNELTKILCNDEVKQIVTQKQIKWRFIVERAAWWGGFWERLIKTVKDALKLILGKACVDYDELQTTLTEIEATVNMRPLTYIHNDPDDLLILTPSHFLLGSSNCGFSIDLKKPDIKRDEILKQWKLRNEVVQKFWKRWSTDYLQQLRSAVHTNVNVKSTCLKVGDIVLLYEQNMPRLSWKLCRITQVFYGRDGKIRACEIITPNRTMLKRPIQLLFPLELTAAVEDVENCNPGNTAQCDP